MLTRTAPLCSVKVAATHTVCSGEYPFRGQDIGTAIAATDPDNDILTYTLGGTDAAAFRIASTTGQLQTKAALDYETKNTYSVTVSVSDGKVVEKREYLCHDHRHGCQ